MTSPVTQSPRRPLHGVPTGSPARFDLPLEHTPTAAAVARHRCRPLLTAWGLDEDHVYDVLLVISELVTDAVTHALPPAVLRLCLRTDGSAGEQVRVHVGDGGPRAAPANRADLATA